jgi:hypothetical protein
MALDGVKMARELARWRAEWKAAGNTAHHAGGGWPNRWVEAARVSAYAAGHIDAVAYPLLVFVGGAGWVVALVIYSRFA